MDIELFKEEKINFEEIDSTEEIDVSNREINEKYKKGEVRIVTEQARYPLNTIVPLLKSENYILNPEFQRRHRWDKIKKSRLIESFIMNVPIPPIFLYEVDYSVYEVMDGLQRLTAIYEFYQNNYKLDGLEEWKELNGSYYKELPEQIRKGINRRYISSIILLQETARDKDEAQRLKQLVFERINSGGVNLERQETRNALYNGKLNQLCIDLSSNKYLCKMWNIPEHNSDDINNVPQELLENRLYRKMEDVELVLRFFAYRQIDKMKNATNTNDFLDYFLIEGNSFDKNIINNYEKIFEDTIKLVYDILGENAFCLYRERQGDWKWYNRPTKAVYDPLMQVMSQYLDFGEVLVEKKETINIELADFYKENYDDFGGRNTNKNHVIKRIELLSDFFKQYIEEDNNEG